MQFTFEHKKCLLGNHQLIHWCLIPYVQRKLHTVTRDKKETEMIALDPFVLPQGYYIKPQTIVLVLPFITKDLCVWIIIFVISVPGFSSCGSLDGTIRTVAFVSNKSRAARTSLDRFFCWARAASCCFVSKRREDTRKREGEASLLLCDCFE